MGKRGRGLLLLYFLLVVLLCGSTGALGAPTGGEQGGAQEGAALTWVDEVKKLDQAPEGYQEDLDNQVVTIFDAQGLAWFAYQVNESGRTFAGITVELADDIDLAGKQWVPVGNSRFYPRAGSSLTSARFSGVFEGNGHRISGMTIHGYQDPYGELAGLFGHTVDAVIQNVTLEDAAIVLDLQDRPTSETGSRIRTAGLLASWIVSTEIENVTVSGSLSVTVAERFVFSGFGGMVGLADCVMDQKDSVPIPQEGSAIRNCQASQVAITYTGSSGDLFSTPVGFGGLVGAQGVLYGADIFFGPGGGTTNTSLPTTIEGCQVNQLAVTRQASDGSVHEGIGGLIACTDCP